MKKTGIALGSGGARGLAHIGVLEELVAMGIKPAVVAGTSIGSMVGAGYCSGHLDEMRELALDLDVRTFLFRFMDFGMPRSGLVEGKRVNELLEEIMPNATFENLDIPLRCVATDLRTGEEVVFSKGRLQPAIRASISIPGVFSPARDGERLLVDGGLVNPIPVNHVRDMGAKRVVAVDVNHGCLASLRQSSKKKKSKPKGPVAEWLKSIEKKLGDKDAAKLEKVKEWFRPDPMPNLVDVLGYTIHIVENQIGKVRLETESPDILLTPEVGDMEVFDFHHAEEIIEAGRRCVRERASDIKKALK